MTKFHTASDEEIMEGKTTDSYFLNALDAIKGLDGGERGVIAEVSAYSLPPSYNYGVFLGLGDSLGLLKGRRVDVYAMAEGTFFFPREVVMRIEGPYVDFCALETPLLGLLCHSSGIATKASRIKKVAGDKTVLSFGVRRIHPAIAPMVDRAAYVGGCDGFSCVAAEKYTGKRASGTMPHSLVIYAGDQKKGWKAFDQFCDPSVPRIALVDTYCDEKEEAVKAARTIDLDGVRLDTPSSRRGDMAEIVREVRWELAIRGFEKVKIFVSGGLDEDEVKGIDADGYGVGTSISNAPVINFALDIVEMDGEPVAKRGKLGGKKQIWRCFECMESSTTLDGSKPPLCPSCSKEMVPILKRVMRSGEPTIEGERDEEIRKRVLDQLGSIDI
jgi:nicotinate phosphoribosyltransferase